MSKTVGHKSFNIGHNAVRECCGSAFFSLDSTRLEYIVLFLRFVSVSFFGWRVRVRALAAISSHINCNELFFEMFVLGLLASNGCSYRVRHP